MKEPLLSEIFEIIRLGHPILREMALELPQGMFGTPELRRLEHGMIQTMQHAEGVGLAAPQVAKGLRCFVYCVPGETEEKNEIAPRLLVNPVLEPIAKHLVAGWEGCLSIPGLRGLVPRCPEIQVRAYDVEGNLLQFVATDFHARVIQHEQDHLDGIVFLDRMEDLDALGYEEEWGRYLVKQYATTEK